MLLQSALSARRRHVETYHDIAKGNSTGLLWYCSLNCSRKVERYRRPSCCWAGLHIRVGGFEKLRVHVCASHCAKALSRGAARGTALLNIACRADVHAVEDAREVWWSSRCMTGTILASAAVELRVGLMT
jgi:hypothetical protein